MALPIISAEEHLNKRHSACPIKGSVSFRPLSWVNRSPDPQQIPPTLNAGSANGQNAAGERHE